MAKSEEFFDDQHRFSVNRKDVQIQGYLLKKSSSGAWQKRYFETSGGYLTYYRNHKMSKLLAAISIPQVGAIRRVGQVEDALGKGVIFEVELRDRIYSLRAESEAEAAQWIDFLTDLRDGNLNNGSSASNPLNHSFDVTRRSKFDIEPTATATINKSARVNMCGCFRVNYH